MRQLLAIVLLAACSAPRPVDSAHSSASPQLKSETISGCNAVNLKIDLAADGTIRVNGDPSSMEGVKEAALKKDAACQNAAAMVVYSYDTESPAEPRDAIKLLPKQTIVNLSLIEAGQG